MQVAGHDLSDIANGFLIVVVGVLSWLGVRGGRKAETSPTAEIAGAIVDRQTTEHLTAAIEQQTEELKNGRHQMERNATAICRAVDDLGEEVGRLRDEMIRRGRD